MFIDTDKPSVPESTAIKDLVACADAPLTTTSIVHAFTALLQAHYSHTSNYGSMFAHMKCIKWGDDGNIAITAKDVIDGAGTDSFPGIFVGRGAIKLAKTGFSDSHSMSQDTARTTIAKFTSLALEVTHVHKRADIAYDLAELTATTLMALSTIMRDRLGLSMVDVTDVTKPTKLKASPNAMYQSTVVVALHYTWAANINIESHRIKKFTLDMDPVY